MPCQSCTKPHEYNLTCLACCARLVMSTYPDVLQRNVMMETIQRHRDSPTRAAIVAEVKRQSSLRESGQLEIVTA